MDRVNSYRDPDFDGSAPLPGYEHLGRAIVDADGQPSGSEANYEYLRGSRHPDGHVAARAALTAESLAGIGELFGRVGTIAGTTEIEQLPPETDGDVPIFVRRSTVAEPADGSREDNPPAGEAGRRRTRNGGAR